MRTDGVDCLESARPDRASSPQGSSKRLLPLQVTMNQLMCASLFSYPIIMMLPSLLGNPLFLLPCIVANCNVSTY